MSENFNLDDDDEFAIEVATRIVRHMAGDPQLTSDQLHALADALYCLERMPRSTPGAHCEFGVTSRTDYGISSGMHYVEFQITTEWFSVELGGSENSGDGYDAFDEPGYWFYLDGRRCRGCQMSDVEERVYQMLNSGARIRASSESEIREKAADSQSNISQ